MAIADDIKQLRKQLGLTQEQLGQKLGVAGRVVRRWEAKVHQPDPKYLAGLASLAENGGLHRLAYRFAHTLIDELGLERLQLGIWSAQPPYQVVVSDFQEPYVQHKVDPDAPGLMLVTFRGPEAQNYARSFFETFGRYLYGSPQEKEQAKALLEPFHQAAFRAWRGSK
jgi:transcriptional regulator with XRE-family HTH domain